MRERHAWVAGELAFWRCQAGDAVPVLEWLADPFARQIAGDWRAAAAAWRRLGCPYDEARALADGDEAARRFALETFLRLGARGPARSLGRRLRATGLGPVPRGLYSATRANPFGLSPRQAEILAPLGTDLTNTDIADRLSLAPKTVEHHVAAVLDTLDVGSRKAAAAMARERRLLGPT